MRSSGAIKFKPEKGSTPDESSRIKEQPNTIFISAQVCGKINCVIASYFIELESFICYLNHNIFHAF